MARKRYRAEEIIHLLREAEVALAQGQKTPQVCKTAHPLRTREHAC